LEKLKVGLLHHLCRYWHGPSGLGRDEQFRLLTSPVFECWNFILEAIKAPGIGQSRAAIAALICIAELFHCRSITNRFIHPFTGSGVTTGKRRIAVSLKLVGRSQFQISPTLLTFLQQYQSLLHNFVDALNAHHFGDTVPDDLNECREEADTNVTMDWFVDGPLFESNSEPIDRQTTLGWFLTEMTKKDSLLLCDNGLFEVRNGESSTYGRNLLTKSIIQLSEEIAPKLKLSEEQNSSVNTSQTTHQMPVYIMPDHQVLLGRLLQLEKVMAISRLSPVILPSVIAQLDKMKRENPQAREAIRWLEAAVPRGRVKIFSPMGMPSASSGLLSGAGPLVEEACAFLSQKNVLNRQSLFATLLTTKSAPDGTIPIPGIFSKLNS